MPVVLYWHAACTFYDRKRTGASRMSVLSEDLLVVPFEDGYGAEVRNVEVRTLSDNSFSAIQDVLDSYGVLLIRNQSLDPDELHRFVARFGDLEGHTLQQYTLPGDPMIYVLANIKENGKDIGAHNEGIGWHTDLSYKQRPVMATALYSLICPTEGADTLIASMSAAFDALPEERRLSLEGLKVHHSYHRWMATRADRAPLTEQQKAMTPDVRHPLVRTHPATGRKALFLGTGTVMGIEGMPEKEGKALVDELVAFATQPQFVHRHRWQEGDFLMWDNRSTMHTATPFDDTKYARKIYRLMVKGDVPF